METVLDYSAIDSNEKAKALFVEGQLVKLYLMPLAFGGEDLPINTLFVPAFANNSKNNFDEEVYNMLKSGFKLHYSATPQYKGNSFIPCKLVISLQGDKTITEEINIW